VEPRKTRNDCKTKTHLAFLPEGLKAKDPKVPESAQVRIVRPGLYQASCLSPGLVVVILTHQHLVAAQVEGTLFGQVLQVVAEAILLEWNTPPSYKFLW